MRGADRDDSGGDGGGDRLREGVRDVQHAEVLRGVVRVRQHLGREGEVDRHERAGAETDDRLGDEHDGDARREGEGHEPDHHDDAGERDERAALADLVGQHAAERAGDRHGEHGREVGDEDRRDRGLLVEAELLGEVERQEGRDARRSRT